METELKLTLDKLFDEVSRLKKLYSIDKVNLGILYGLAKAAEEEINSTMAEDLCVTEEQTKKIFDYLSPYWQEKSIDDLDVSHMQLILEQQGIRQEYLITLLKCCNCSLVYYNFAKHNVITLFLR